MHSPCYIILTFLKMKIISLLDLVIEVKRHSFHADIEKVTFSNFDEILKEIAEAGKKIAATDNKDERKRMTLSLWARLQSAEKSSKSQMIQLFREFPSCSELHYRFSCDTVRHSFQFLYYRQVDIISVCKDLENCVKNEEKLDLQIYSLSNMYDTLSKISDVSKKIHNKEISGTDFSAKTIEQFQNISLEIDVHERQIIGIFRDHVTC